jgi:hypothetical protein
MADKERFTEQIKFMTEMLRLSWLSLLAVTSGVVGLLLGELDVRRLTFAAVGVVAMTLFLVFIGHLVRRITTIIDKRTEV